MSKKKVIEVSPLESEEMDTQEMVEQVFEPAVYPVEPEVFEGGEVVEAGETPIEEAPPDVPLEPVGDVDTNMGISSLNLEESRPLSEDELLVSEQEEAELNRLLEAEEATDHTDALDAVKFVFTSTEIAPPPLTEAERKQFELFETWLNRLDEINPNHLSEALQKSLEYMKQHDPADFAEVARLLGPPPKGGDLVIEEATAVSSEVWNAVEEMLSPPNWEKPVAHEVIDQVVKLPSSVAALVLHAKEHPSGYALDAENNEAQAQGDGTVRVSLHVAGKGHQRLRLVCPETVDFLVVKDEA